MKYSQELKAKEGKVEFNLIDLSQKCTKVVNLNMLLTTESHGNMRF